MVDRHEDHDEAAHDVDGLEAFRTDRSRRITADRPQLKLLQRSACAIRRSTQKVDSRGPDC